MRIFWLGMHKVLSQTELPRLRQLGYEVFNPPYLSNVYDQSANTEWQRPEGSTLPSEVIDALSRINFFYDEISEETSQILNEYFDLAIITINTLWLRNFLRAFKGRVIYRTYGQPYSLSDGLENLDAVRLIVEREGFWFCPHSDKVLDIEDNWLLSRMMVVPYCLTSDVTDRLDIWDYNSSQAEIGLLCPRALDVPYYNGNYRVLKSSFPTEGYKIFGAQNILVADPQVIGTIPRDEFLRMLCGMRGFVYHYTEPTVCYLPPIEFMMLGGPVIFQRGSLLGRYFSGKTPGQCTDIREIVNVAERLRAGDRVLSTEIVASQQDVRRLYHPDFVWPIFDRAMQKMLGDAGNNAALNVTYPSQNESRIVVQSDNRLPVVLIPFHGFGPLITRQGGEYLCAEGIARVTRQFARALTDSGFKVIVTANSRDFGRVHGFFSSAVSRPDLLQVYCIDQAHAKSGSHTKRGISTFWKRYIDLARTRPIAAYRPYASLFLARRQYLSLAKLGVSFAAVGFAKLVNRGAARVSHTKLYGALLGSNGYVATINSDPSITHVLIPHYYMFPELSQVKGKKIVLYLPDYMPHFYPESAEMGATNAVQSIGKTLSGLADYIVTNSAFTKSYLPMTELAVAQQKIVHIPLPNLNVRSSSDETGDSQIQGLPQYYVFYPTRDRPSKRLKEFVATVQIVNNRLSQQGRSERVYGVLTTQLSRTSINYADDILILDELTDTALAKVYEQALCVLFTSEMEGNFPTQITEALHFKVPVVAGRIPLITLELGDAAESLQLQELGDCEGYADRVLAVLADRTAAVRSQEPAREVIFASHTFEKFKDELIEVFKCS